MKKIQENNYEQNFGVRLYQQQKKYSKKWEKQEYQRRKKGFHKKNWRKEGLRQGGALYNIVKEIILMESGIRTESFIHIWN